MTLVLFCNYHIYSVDHYWCFIDYHHINVSIYIYIITSMYYHVHDNPPPHHHHHHYHHTQHTYHSHHQQEVFSTQNNFQRRLWQAPNDADLQSLPASTPSSTLLVPEQVELGMDEGEIVQQGLRGYMGKGFRYDLGVTFFYFLKLHPGSVYDSCAFFSLQSKVFTFQVILRQHF